MKQPDNDLDEWSAGSAPRLPAGYREGSRVAVVPRDRRGPNTDADTTIPTRLAGYDAPCSS